MGNIVASGGQEPLEPTADHDEPRSRLSQFFRHSPLNGIELDLSRSVEHQRAGENCL